MKKRVLAGLLMSALLTAAVPAALAAISIGWLWSVSDSPLLWETYRTSPHR